MAFAAGCTGTFHALPLVEGVQSQGECTVSGQLIGFRVQRDIDFGDPWPTASTSDHYVTGVGNGWVAHGSDRATFDAVFARLAP